MIRVDRVEGRGWVAGGEARRREPPVAGGGSLGQGRGKDEDIAADASPCG